VINNCRFFKIPSGACKGLILALLFGPARMLSAATYYVALDGSDSNAGAKESPLRHIQSAAQKAMPGDTVIVRAGVYRECIIPPRGGDSEERRIVYKAAPGEQVVITGSEPSKTWTRENDNTWKMTVPNSFFGDTNPFDELLYGAWYKTSQPNHTGTVYLKGKMMKEVRSTEEVSSSPSDNVWHAEADGNGGPVVMNLDWILPEGGRKYTSECATVEGGDAGVEGGKGRDPWPFGYLKNGSVLHYQNIDFGSGIKQLEMQAATMAKEGIVDIHMETVDGKLLGQARITNTGNWQSYKTFTAGLSEPISGVHNVALVIKAPRPAINGTTTIWARFPKEIDPNDGSVEISARSKVFYPAKTGCNYITVSGFVLENAACNFASPSAEQPGLIGPHWARNWIIENNTIRNARCSGISLGRPTYGHSHQAQVATGVAQNLSRVYPEEGCGQTEQQLIDYFKTMSWTKKEAGFHIVRNNKIYDCGQAGIVGCSGGAFSVIEGNDIHDIHVNETFTGAEMAAIKLHYAIDTIIRNNHLYSSKLGLWLDWGSQGTIVDGNLFHDNKSGDINREVCHGPTLFLNNLMFSKSSEVMGTHGCAWVNNLLLYPIKHMTHGRKTPFFHPHDTTSVKIVDNNQLGDIQYLNNIVVTGTKGGNLFDVSKNQTLPVTVAGNLLLGNSHEPPGNPANIVFSGAEPPQLICRGNEWYVQMKSGPLIEAIKESRRDQITSKTLGLTHISQQGFTMPDDSPIVVDKDYFGKTRNDTNPASGPFEHYEDEIKVWPK
jgi:hypothetical protein